ncbi:MAG: tetratricopeptide repeat protein [Phycisphaerales bacterium]
MGRGRGSRAVGLWVALVGSGLLVGSAGADGSLQAGHGMLQRGLYDLAAQEYEGVLQDPGSPLEADEARYGLAVCSYRTGDLEGSLGQLERIRGVDGFGFAADAAVIRAHALFGLGRYEDAGRAFVALAEDHEDHAATPAGVALGVEALHRAGEDRAAVRFAEERGGLVSDDAASARMALFVGQSRERLGDLDGAVATLTPVARDASGSIADHAGLRLATILHRLGRLDEAQPWYERVAGGATDSVRPSALMGLGTVRRVQGDAEGALDAIGQLQRAFPEHESARAAYEAARARFDLGQFERAQAGLDALADADPGDLADEAAYWAAKAALRSGDAADASARLASAVDSFGSGPLGAEMRYDLGVALQRAGDAAASRDAYGAFRQRHADHDLVADALLAEASLSLDLDDPEGALERAETMLNEHGSHAEAPIAALIRGEALHRLGRFDDAVAQFATLVDLERLSTDDRARAAYRLGLGLWRLGRHDDAARPLARVADGTQTDPRFREALLALGDGAFARRAWEEAESFLRDYLGLDPGAEGAADARLQLGLAIARQDRPDEARAMFEELLASEGGERHAAHATFELGQAHVELGDDAAARAALEAVLDMDGAERFEPYATRHLGAIAMRAGDGAEAATWYARAERSGEGVFTGDELIEIATDRAGALVNAGDPAGAAESAARYDGWEANPRARAWRAVALSRTGEHAPALDVARGTQTDSLDAELAALLGYEVARSLRELGRDDEARSAYRELIENERAAVVRAHALADLGTSLLDAGELGEAADILERALAITDLPEDLCRTAMYQTAWARLELGDARRAATLLDADTRQCELAELEAPGELVYGEALLALGRAGDAADRLAIAASHRDAPSHETALLRLGEAQSRAQRWDASRETFETHLRDYPESDDWFRSRFGIGWALENAGEPEAAIEHYRALVEGHEGLMTVRAQFQIGECLFALGRHEEAARELLRVDVLYEPTEWTPAALFEAGRCFEAMNKVGEARAEYRAVVERFGDSDWAAMARDRLARLRSGAAPGRSGGGGS